MQAHACPRAAEAKFRFLYLGNDLKLIAAVRQLLREPDYQLVACGDPGSAILFLRSEIPYDLLLIDFQWRGKEGLELANFAHSLPHRKRMPLILVTATKSNRQDSLVHQAGVVEVVTKTTDMAGLKEAVTRLLTICPQRRRRRSRNARREGAD